MKTFRLLFCNADSKISPMEIKAFDIDSVIEKLDDIKSDLIDTMHSVIICDIDKPTSYVIFNLITKEKMKW